MAPFSLSTNRRFCYVRTRYSFHCSHLVFRLAFSLTWSVVVPALMGEKPFSLEYNTIDEARKWQKYLRKVKQIRFRLDRVLRAEGLCFVQMQSPRTKKYVIVISVGKTTFKLTRGILGSANFKTEASMLDIRCGFTGGTRGSQAPPFVDKFGNIL